MPSFNRYIGLPLLLWSLLIASTSWAQPAVVESDAQALAKLFPAELTQFEPYPQNPIFTGRGPGHWDALIRERGWILREGDRWHLWYTGYETQRRDWMRLGYATSSDGLHWQRHGEPLDAENWIEDMMVLRDGDTYYMFAEGVKDQAHWFTSTDAVHWQRQGQLDIRYTDGSPLKPGPFGTPFVWREEDTWYLTYERGDRGVWLATSPDLQRWTHVQDEPILVPNEAEHGQIAVNQILRRDGRYFAIYHALDDPQQRIWNTHLATSTDLLNWQRYPHNPLVVDNQSSGVYVATDQGLRLYTMHPQVNVYLPVNQVQQGNQQ